MRKLVLIFALSALAASATDVNTFGLRPRAAPYRGRPAVRLHVLLGPELVAINHKKVWHVYESH